MKKALMFTFSLIFSVFISGQEFQEIPLSFKKPPNLSDLNPFKLINHKERRQTDLANWNLTNFNIPTKTIKHKMDSVTYNGWDENTAQWIAGAKDEYEYDTKGNLIKEIWYEIYEGKIQWYAFTNWEYCYDENDYLNYYINYDRDWITGEWYYFGKGEYTYDSSGNEIMFLYFQWDENYSQWGKVSKLDYTYDINGNLIQSISQEWNDSINQWINYKKSESTYDGNGRMTNSMSYEWDENNNQWNYFAKSEYTYDTNGNNTQNVSSQWINDQWLADRKYEYTYVANGNLINYISSDWVSDSNQWINTNKREYIYNNSYSYDQLVIPFFYSNNYFNHMQTENIGSYRDNDLNQWVIFNNRQYFYTEQNIGKITEVNTLLANIYPNPAENYVVFTLNNPESAVVEIFDIKGERVIEQIMRSDKQINVSHLSSGIYFYKITSGNKIISGKLVIK